MPLKKCLSCISVCKVAFLKGNSSFSLSSFLAISYRNTEYCEYVYTHYFLHSDCFFFWPRPLLLYTHVGQVHMCVCVLVAKLNYVFLQFPIYWNTNNIPVVLWLKKMTPLSQHPFTAETSSSLCGNLMNPSSTNGGMLKALILFRPYL